MCWDPEIGPEPGSPGRTSGSALDVAFRQQIFVNPDVFGGYIYDLNARRSVSVSRD
jgi:hypothetical protein